jgi:hypothetical protein
MVSITTAFALPMLIHGLVQAARISLTAKNVKHANTNCSHHWPHVHLVLAIVQ